MNVTIIFTGLPEKSIRQAMSIPATFQRTGSYVDSEAYVKGNNATAEGTQVVPYGKSIYATNVWDDAWFNTLPGLIPMASTTTKFAALELAVRAYADWVKAGAAEGGNTGVTFTIDGYEDEIYWKQMAFNLADENFEITVSEGNKGDGGEGGEG